MSEDRPRIITNNVPRDVIYANELSQKDREEFGYHDWEKIDAGEESPEFFRYRGTLYDLSQFSRTDRNGNLSDWNGCSADSAFSATLVRYVENGERVIVGTYIA
ncbi:hypothetical protein AB0G15_05865 [Streptosporangium sp. NPDC023825]|uniref:hypothetical protein n=1 Tax=Streptosporangium sp. NPDC023825 TaxID=3154909 RepID=UPI003448F5FD